MASKLIALTAAILGSWDAAGSTLTGSPSVAEDNDLASAAGGGVEAGGDGAFVVIGSSRGRAWKGAIAGDGLARSIGDVDRERDARYCGSGIGLFSLKHGDAGEYTGECSADTGARHCRSGTGLFSLKHGDAGEYSGDLDARHCGSGLRLFSLWYSDAGEGSPDPSSSGANEATSESERDSQT